MSSTPLLLCDGHNLLFRACFGTPARIWSRDLDGRRDITTQFMFFALLRKAINDEFGTWPEVIVVFDGEEGSARRKEADPCYKASRPGNPEALRPIRALGDVKAGLDAYGITWIEVRHAEADDVIATLTAASASRDVLIMSADQDYYQLLSDAGPGRAAVRVLNTARRPGSRLIGPAEVTARYGVGPALYADFRALCGDPSDNIPGARGIGIKTAAALLAGGLTLEDLPSSGRLARGRGQSAAAVWEQVLTWRSMIRMRADITVPATPTGVATAPLPTTSQVIDKLGLWQSASCASPPLADRQEKHLTGIASAAEEAADAARLREVLTGALIADGWITSPGVEAAFRAVPRHLFVPPGTSLEAAYANDIIRIKFDPGGTCLSSVSAPWLQAKMIDQAGIVPGMRVLEVGSGGYNAALLAEVTGPFGHVVTIDIDPAVTAKASAALKAAGYAGRVTVITADAEHGAPDHGPFDAVIVTVGAQDIAPAWISQLTVGGTLVVPLRMNGWTRSIAFRRHGGHLASTSAQVCGFVPIQGDGALVEQATALDAPGGGHVLVRCEIPATDLTALPWDLLSDGPYYAWSGFTIAPMISHADLFLWLGGFISGFCKISAEAGAQLPGDPDRPGRSWFPAAIASNGSLAYHVMRKAPGGDYEFGACSYGPRASGAADMFLSAVADWTRHGRDLPEDVYTYYPDGITPPPADDRAVGVFRKRHGTLTITWPDASPA